MKKIFIIKVILLSLVSCYQSPKLDGWVQNDWTAMTIDCDQNRHAMVTIVLLPQQKKILGKNQNEIEKLLGNPDRHQLYDRNQKFFYYKMDCENEKELSVRFDALGRVKEIQVQRVSQ
jgi:hypothetical protein